MGNPFICLIVGPSGSGKTTIANFLSARNGWSQVESYTTRAPRYDGERGHTFITEEEFRILDDLVAYTEYNGHRYGATARQINSCEVYVVDIPGVESLVRNYGGDKHLIAVIPWINEEERRRRMSIRGDAPEKIEERIEHDRIVFDDVSWKLCDLVGDENVLLMDNLDSETTAELIEEHLKIIGLL